MLAIQRDIFDRVKNIKAISAGAIAFGIGLTGAAAYIGSSMVYDNFAYDLFVPKVAGTSTSASTTAEIKAENGESGVPGRGSNFNWTSTSPNSPGNSSSMVTTSPTGGSTSTTPVIGGMGGGSAPSVSVSSAPAITAPAPTPTPVIPTPVLPPAPLPTPAPQVPVVDPLLNRVDDAVDVIVVPEIGL